MKKEIISTRDMKINKIRTVVIVLLTECFANGDQTVVHVSVGETITLKCPLLSHLHSDVQWNHIDTKTVISDGTDINPKISNKAEYTKFEIIGNHSTGEYNLKIRNIEIDDEGVYRCDSEINGKPESRFINLIISILDHKTNIIIVSKDNVTHSYNHKIQGFSIDTWFVIFISVLSGIVILPIAVAGALKLIRLDPNESDDNINLERTETDPQYETINDTVVTNPHVAALPNVDIIVSRLQVHHLGMARSSALSSSINVQNVLYSLESPSAIPNTLNVDKNLNNDNITDSNSDISSTYNVEASLDLVSEAPYVNHYQPLSMSFERVTHVYDVCCVE